MANLLNPCQRAILPFTTRTISLPWRLSFSHPSKLLWITMFLLVIRMSDAVYNHCYDDDNNEYKACHPSAFNLMSGSQVKVTLDPADATCGIPASNYRRLGIRRGDAETCDANSVQDRHPLDFMYDGDLATWWQSKNQLPTSKSLDINITISFGKLQRFAGDLTLTFNSGRPEKMALEKSTDFGATWTLLQDYSSTCSETVPPDNPTAVICTNSYVETSSRPPPGQRVKFAVQEDRLDPFMGPPPGMDYSTLYPALDGALLEFLLFTDLRIRLEETATDNRDNYDMYYYGIAEIEVIGRCFCNLHAKQCNIGDDGQVACVCQHNTMGKDCESCLPLYNNKPWKRGTYTPYSVGTPNECSKCECNDHAESCTYNTGIGAGVCDVCLHNTAGNNCELCLPGFYRDVTVSLNNISVCLDCNCEPLGTVNNNQICAQAESPGIPIGQCSCKQLVTGLRCDRCSPGFFGLYLGPQQGTCRACNCNLDGTVEQSNTCTQNEGQCPCKNSITGTLCDTCEDGFYAFPSGEPGKECLPCNCDKGGSLSQTCDKVSGKCQCKPGIDGQKCGRAASGSFVPAVDQLGFEPLGGGTCPVKSDLWVQSAPFDKTGYAECDVSAGATVSVSFQVIPGGMRQKALLWPYYPAIRYTNPGSEVTATVNLFIAGDTEADLSALSTLLGQPINPGCPLPGGPSGSAVLTLSTGSHTAVMLDSTLLNLDARCQYTAVLQLTRPVPPSNAGSASRKKRDNHVDPAVQIDSLQFLPALKSSDGSVEFQTLATSANKDETTATYLACLRQVSSLKTRQSAMNLPPCNDLLFAVAAELTEAASDCDCDPDGSLNVPPCRSLGGQCACKAGVSGRRCDTCTPGYFNFTANGCEPCNCHPQGSDSGACDYTTGQCTCKTNVALKTPPGDAASPVVDGTCGKCLENFYGIDSGVGCSACLCNVQGSSSLQCDATGQCPCKDSVQGLKCSECRDLFYGFGAEGCSACSCSEAGSRAAGCEQTSGQCPCKENAVGRMCDTCKPNFFNLAITNPSGCQPCFCYLHGQSCSSADGFQLAVLEVTDPKDYSKLGGDRHTSYGQRLTLQLTAGYNLDISGERLLTIQGNGKTVFHTARANTVIAPSSPLQYEIRLLEQEWFEQGADTTTVLSALDVMGVLGNITFGEIITSSKGQVITTNSVALEVAVLAPGTGNVTFVENCVCQASFNVAGLSCEDCATGFMRQTQATASSYDACVACDCNARGATTPPECDALTGVCLNCRNGTLGDHCESCAGFVTGPNCDTCQSAYWGLQADGCRACDCSAPASLSPVCNDGTGQCTCAANVVGRTCDKCEENFHSLSQTGCLECSSCYTLVKDAVTVLRESLAYLEANLTILENRDALAPLEPFTTRFQKVQQDTQRLIVFLQSAEASQTEVTNQIQAFTTSLQSVKDQLTTLETSTVVDIEAALAQVDTSLKIATSYRQSTESSAQQAYTKLATLESAVSTLRSLSQSLDSVRQYLLTLAQSSSSNTQLINVLRELDATAARANDAANAALTRGQSALSTHRNTTARLLTLDADVINLVSRCATALNNAQSLSTDSRSLQSTVSRLLSELEGISSFVVPLSDLESQTNSARSFTESMQTQLTARAQLFTPSNNRALATPAQISELTTQASQQVSVASDWIARSAAADHSVEDTQDKVNALFTSAENTLKTLQDFAAQASDVEKRATESLKQVETVRSQSALLMQQAENLTDTLAPLQQTSSSAKTTSQQTLQIITQKEARVQLVATAAKTLQKRLDNTQSGGSQRTKLISDTRANTVVPATQQCQDIGDSITEFTSLQAEADGDIANATAHLSVAVQRANQILARLQTIETVDAEAARELLRRVGEDRAALELERYRLAVVELQRARDQQRLRIDNLKALKETVRVRIQAARTVQQQTGSFNGGTT